MTLMHEEPRREPPPFLLPRFTFISGPWHRDQPLRDALASALCELDGELLPLDFEEPLRMATCALFFGGFSLECDLTSPALRAEALLPPTPACASDFISDLRMLLRGTWGEGALGRIALRDYQRDGTDMIYSRCIFRDASHPPDVKVFADTFGHNAILVLHVGELRNAVDFGPGKHIWLPRPSVEKQIEDLTRELTQ